MADRSVSVPLTLSDFELERVVKIFWRISVITLNTSALKQDLRRRLLPCTQLPDITHSSQTQQVCVIRIRIHAGTAHSLGYWQDIASLTTSWYLFTRQHCWSRKDYFKAINSNKAPLNQWRFEISTGSYGLIPYPIQLGVTVLVGNGVDQSLWVKSTCLCVNWILARKWWVNSLMVTEVSRGGGMRWRQEVGLQIS